MSKLRCHISISLDGFVAGPNQSEENPLGEGGERLHDWVVPLAAWRQSHGEQGGEVNESARIVEESRENIGAGVMGRNMFGPVHGGAWGDEQWTGWWGDNPPYHYPVFILTHHPRDPVEMEGGTTFHFVTDGIESALEQARKAAGGKDVMLWGGANIAQQYLATGLLDELELHVVPVLLGDGARFFDNLGNAEVQLEQVRAGSVCGMPCCPTQVSGRGVRMAGRRAGLSPRDLPPRPGTPAVDRPTWTVVLRPCLLEVVQHVLRAVSCPDGQKAVIVVLEAAAATHSDEPRIPDLGEDHQLPNLAFVSAWIRSLIAATVGSH